LRRGSPLLRCVCLVRRVTVSVCPAGELTSTYAWQSKPLLFYSVPPTGVARSCLRHWPDPSSPRLSPVSSPTADSTMWWTVRPPCESALPLTAASLCVSLPRCLRPPRGTNTSATKEVLRSRCCVRRGTVTVLCVVRRATLLVRVLTGRLGALVSTKSSKKLSLVPSLRLRIIISSRECQKRRVGWRRKCAKPRSEGTRWRTRSGWLPTPSLVQGVVQPSRRTRAATTWGESVALLPLHRRRWSRVYLPLSLSLLRKNHFNYSAYSCTCV
jgi:hypothetical protein